MSVTSTSWLCGPRRKAVRVRGGAVGGRLSGHGRGSWRAVWWGQGFADSNLRYPVRVSPTVLRIGGFRFYFFSREEPRAYVHVQHADGEAKFWIEPNVELAVNYGLTSRQVTDVRTLIEEHVNEIRNAWAKHFAD